MATRFYFDRANPAAVSPAIDAGWDYIDEFVRRRLRYPKEGILAPNVGSLIGSWSNTAGTKALDRQHVSDPIGAQTISGTVKMQLQVAEQNVVDNVDQIILSIRVFSGDGSTLRGTLLSIGSYGPTSEFNVTQRNKTGADGDTLSSLAVENGDRLVVEVGYSNSTTADGPNAQARWGDNATDCPEDETTTATRAGWVEFSQDITFAGQILNGSGAISGTGLSTGLGSVAKRGSGAISGTGTLSGLGSVAKRGSGAISGSGLSTGLGSVAKRGSGAISGSGALSGAGLYATNSSGSISGSGTVTGSCRVLRPVNFKGQGVINPSFTGKIR